jgi:dynein heavy chain, axonemal
LSDPLKISNHSQTSSYQASELQTLFDKLGRENRKVVFLFTDAHIVDEGFLELINNMLTTGMVPALYDEGEKDACINSVREEVAQAGLPTTKEFCWARFVKKCRGNLHVVLAMSPVGDKLRTRCRNFPGMVNNTVIDWFDPWPQQALSAVATVFLEKEDLADGVKPEIVKHMMMVHQSVRTFSSKFMEELRRHNYVTPKNYLDFIATYRSSLAFSRKGISDMATRLDGGLQKLVQAATEVEVMKKELSEAKVVVEAATKACNELIATITQSRAEVEAKSLGALQKEQQLKIDSADIAVEKQEAETALAEAIPALEEAAAALQDLKKDDITEIRSFAKPNVYVQKVCECVVFLKGGKDPSWNGAKAMMSDGQFLRSLLEFDKDALSDKQVGTLDICWVYCYAWS